MLTAGQVHDVHGGRALLAAVPPMRRLTPDKAYDADDLRAFLARQGTEAVISPMPTRLAQPAFNPLAYLARNLIERAFCRLKDWCAVATRYNKTEAAPDFVECLRAWVLTVLLVRPPSLRKRPASAPCPGAGRCSSISAWARAMSM